MRRVHVVRHTLQRYGREVRGIEVESFNSLEDAGAYIHTLNSWEDFYVLDDDGEKVQVREIVKYCAIKEEE